MKKVRIKKLDIKRDERGWLSEILRSEETGNHPFGQILITTAKQGYTKGNHYHTRKTEWYCVIKGKARLVIRNIKKEKRQEITLDANSLCVVTIPPYHAHAITNIGSDDMHLLAYIDESFDPKDPDTYNKAP